MCGPASTPPFRASGGPHPTVPFRSAEAAASSGGKRGGREAETLPLPTNTPNIKCRYTGCPKFCLLPSKVKSTPVSTEVVCPLVSRNYKVSATVGVNTVIMVPCSAILDTGAGPNLIREEILPEDWERSRLSGTTAYQIIGGRASASPTGRDRDARAVGGTSCPIAFLSWLRA
jgi:hypothetical protein